VHGYDGFVPGFDWQELAALCVGLLAVGGSMVWGLRLSRLSTDAIRRDVAAFDAVLRALAAPELRVHPGPVYEHPTVGTIPAHSTLVGALHGYGIYVELHNPWTEYPEYILRVRVTAPLGQVFDAARATSALSGWDPKHFETRVDARSLVVAEKPSRTSPGADLRANPTHLANHLRRVVELARSIAVVDPAAPAPAPSRGALSTLSGKQVFLLEGDRGFAEALRVALLDCGARPRVFEAAQSLIDAAERGLPDLFVVALELPGAGGWGLCNRLKKHGRFASVPLLVVSTASGEEEFQMHQRLSTRAQDYIAKPVSVDHMLARIARQFSLG